MTRCIHIIAEDADVAVARLVNPRRNQRQIAAVSVQFVPCLCLNSLRMRRRVPDVSARAGRRCRFLGSKFRKAAWDFQLTLGFGATRIKNRYDLEADSEATAGYRQVSLPPVSYTHLRAHETEADL
eukprot:630016-Rhodomonas_salina.1